MLRGRSRLATGLIALALLSSLVWTQTADAHPRGLGPAPAPAEVQPLDETVSSLESASKPALASETPAASSLGPAVALLAVFLLGLGAAWWPVFAVRGLLGGLLVVAAVQGAAHSVHHLDDPQAGADCQVLNVTQQLHGETSPELPSGVPVAAFRSYTVIVRSHDTAQAVRRPDEGRAPPLPIA